MDASAALLYFGAAFAVLAWVLGVLTVRAASNRSRHGLPHPYLFVPATIVLFAVAGFTAGRPLVAFVMLTSLAPWLVAAVRHGHARDGSPETLVANEWWDTLAPGQQRRLYREAVDRNEFSPTR